MVDIGLQIVQVQRDPQAAARISSGKYRINCELNEEWIDIQNSGPYVLNLQERALACVRRHGDGFQLLRSARIRANSPIPLQPGQKIRIYTGEQPRVATHIPDSNRISRVLWLVQRSYVWVPQGNEAQLYFSWDDLKQKREPLARYRLL